MPIEPTLRRRGEYCPSTDMATLLANCKHGMCELDTEHGAVCIPYAEAGSGPALLLLHGHPQSRIIWHRMVAALSERFTVVMADLRGYGDASTPSNAAQAPAHAAYSKRAMAADQLALMRSLGHPNFSIIAHDRGARVAHRLALDWPERVQAMMLLDIVPTLNMLELSDQAFAQAYWHWFFLTQASPGPENLIASNPESYLRMLMAKRSDGLAVFAPQAWREYCRYVNDPDTVHAMCEDYRAAATRDAELDHFDRTRGHKLSCPVRVHWGAHGIIAKLYNPLALWRAACAEGVLVEGGPIDCGHYMAEQAPSALLDSIARHWPPG